MEYIYIYGIYMEYINIWNIYMEYIYNGILLSHKKNEIMPFAATEIQLEIIILSELRKKQKTNTYDITYMWHLKHGTNEPI